MTSSSHVIHNNVNKTPMGIPSISYESGHNSCSITGHQSDDSCMLHHTSQSLSTSRLDIQHCLPKNIVFTGEDVAFTSAGQKQTDTRLFVDHSTAGWESTVHLSADTQYLYNQVSGIRNLIYNLIYNTSNHFVVLHTRLSHNCRVEEPFLCTAVVQQTGMCD